MTKTETLPVADIKNELIVGLTIALVVLPQAIAFATTLAYVPPSLGLYSAIWGVIIIALLNPSKLFHGGPNSAMSASIGITLLPIAPQFGASYVGYVLILVLLAGLFQLLIVTIKPLTRILNLINEAVINGMIAGIGLFLIFKSIPTLGGIPSNTEVEWAVIINWHTFLDVLEWGNMAAIEIGAITLVTGIAFKQLKATKQWYIVLALLAGTFYSEYLIASVGNEHLLIQQVANLSQMEILAPSLPNFSQESIPDIISIMPGALTLALLGLFQTTAAMRGINKKLNQHSDIRSGLKADAFANTVLAFCSSLPTCASFNRMWLMHNLGARTKIVAFSSAFILLLCVTFMGDLISKLPLPALAGVIMLVGVNMINFEDFKKHFQSVSEAGIFLASFASIHIFGLLSAIIIGVSLSLIHFNWRLLRPGITQHDGVIKFKGSFYYGSINDIEGLISEMIQKHQTIELDITNVSYFDSEAKRFLIDLTKRTELKYIMSPEQAALGASLIENGLDPRCIAAAKPEPS